MANYAQKFFSLVQYIETNSDCLANVAPRMSGPVLRSPNPKDLATIPLEPMHLHLFRRIEKCLQEKEDYVWLEDAISGDQLLLSQVLPSVRSVASAFSKLGYKKGDITLMFASNENQFFLPVLATWASGGAICPGNTNSTTDQIRKVVEDTAAKVIICDEARLSNVLKAVNQSTSMTNVYVFGKDLNLPLGTAREFNDLLEDDGKAYPESIKFNVREDLAYLAYSSGTTGTPKEVMHTHYSAMATLTQFPTKSMPGLKLLITNWFFHVSGFYITLLWLATGATEYVFRDCTDDQLISNIHKVQPALLGLYPHQVVMLSKNPAVSRFDMSSVVFVVTGGAALAAEAQEGICRRFESLKGVSQAYAMSECMGITSTLCYDKETGEIIYNTQPAGKVGCVGFVSPFSTVKVVDEKSGKVQGVNGVGEICVKSPCMMKAYRNKPEETSKVIDSEGWLHTGDVGYYDDDGQLFFMEREKELLKYKSHQIAPASLESLILQISGVADVAVVGVADDEGELPRAFIVRNNSATGKELTGKDVMHFVNDRVADHERLRGGVVFISTVPRNPNGKILRKELKERNIPQDQIISV